MEVAYTTATAIVTTDAWVNPQHPETPFWRDHNATHKRKDVGRDTGAA